MVNKIVIISSPSGAGKTTLVRHLIELHPEFMFSISATTRPERNGEIDGKDYYFLTLGQFKQKIENREFAEWEEVYPGKYYGTLKSEIERIWKAGKVGIFDIDVKGAVSLKGIYGLKALTIFIAPPTMEALEQRLKKRNTEEPEMLAERLERAKLEMQYKERFDKSVVNDDLDAAVHQTEAIVADFLKN